MLKNLKTIISDTLYVSKLVKTNNKKLIIIFSVALSQLIAYSDILIILFFTSIFTDTPVFPDSLDFLNDLFQFNLLLPIVILVRYFFQYQQSVILKKLEYDVQYNLKTYLLDEIFENRNFSTADTFFYINTLTAHISYFYSSIASFLNFLLQTVAFTTYLFVTEPTTISAFLLGTLTLTYPIFLLIKKSRQYEQLIYEKGLETSKEIQRVLDNVFLIKLLKKEKQESKRYSDIAKDLYADQLKKHKVVVVNSYLPPFITVFLMSIIALYFNNYFVITLSFLGVTLRMFQSLANLTTSFNQIVNSHVHIDTFYNMEKFKQQTYKENYIVNLNNESENIFEIKNASFRYFNSDRDLFRNLNLEIKRNSHTVFTGPNGSGKSTILGLLAGVFYPSEGKIIANSSKLGYVGPTPLIFTSSLRDNLTYGTTSNVSDENIYELLNEFQLFENNKIGNLDKLVSNKSLSSGQMQKIAFIRALLSDIDTLFLDESTSNLDVETKNLIFEILNKNDLTIINSTHDINNFDNVSHHYKIEFNKDYRGIVKIL